MIPYQVESQPASYFSDFVLRWVGEVWCFVCINLKRNVDMKHNIKLQMHVNLYLRVFEVRDLDKVEREIVSSEGIQNPKEA